MEDKVLRINFEDFEEDPETLWDIYPLIWKGRPFTGVAFEIDSNGQIAIEEDIVDGYPDGYSREWYPSGQIKREHYAKRYASYSHIKREDQFGWTKEWFENGVLKREVIRHFYVEIRDSMWNEQGELIYSVEKPEWTI